MSEKDTFEYLDNEEKALIESFEKGEWKSLSGKDRDIFDSKLNSALDNHAKKDARINIRLSKNDLQMLKIRAVREGLPYQTMISSILHKVASGQLDDKL